MQSLYNLNITENNIIYLENKQINLSPPNVLQQQTFWSIGAGLLQELTDLSDIAKTFFYTSYILLLQYYQEITERCQIHTEV